MSVKMSKTKSALLIATVVLSNIAVMGEFATFPVIDSLYSRFAGQEFWVDTWVSINQWTIVIFSILGAAMLKKMSKRTFLILGGVIFTIAGAFGAANGNIIVMVVMRALYGIGVAFCNVGAVAVVAEVYTDEDKMNWVMGIYNALQGAVGAIMSAIGGNMAIISWDMPFKLMWVGVPMTLLFVFCVPYIKPESEEAAVKDNKPKEHLGKVFWATTIAFIMFAAAYAIPSQYSSSYVIDNGIGNETMAGYIGSLGTIGSFLFCLSYEKMFKKLNQRVIVAWYGGAALIIAILFVFRNPLLTYVLYFVLGGSMSIACTYTYAIIPEIVPESRIDSGIGVMTAACCIGYAIAPYFISMVQAVLKIDDITPVFLSAAIVAAIAMAIEIILTNKEIKKQKQAQI